MSELIPVDFVMRQDAEWVIEIQGFLGIINILGEEHLMVLVGKEEADQRAECNDHRNACCPE